MAGGCIFVQYFLPRRARNNESRRRIAAIPALLSSPHHHRTQPRVRSLHRPPRIAPPELHPRRGRLRDHVHFLGYFPRRRLRVRLVENSEEPRGVPVQGTPANDVGRLSTDRWSPARKSEARRLNRLVNILIISALVCLTLTLSHLEPVIDVLHCSILDFIGNPWQWIFYQTGQRVFEISMCVLIMVAMLNSSHNHKKKTSDKENIVNRIALESGMENKGTDSRLELPRTDMQLSFDEKEYEYSHNGGREGIL